MQMCQCHYNAIDCLMWGCHQNHSIRFGFPSQPQPEKHKSKLDNGEWKSKCKSVDNLKCWQKFYRALWMGKYFAKVQQRNEKSTIFFRLFFLFIFLHFKQNNNLKAVGEQKANWPYSLELTGQFCLIDKLTKHVFLNCCRLWTSRNCGNSSLIESNS